MRLDAGVKKILIFIAGVLSLVPLASCVMVPSCPPEVPVCTHVEQLVRELDSERNWSEAADRIFGRGPKEAEYLDAIMCTDGYSDRVCNRAEDLFRRLTHTGYLRLLTSGSLYRGSVPVSHPDLEEVVARAVPLFVPPRGVDNWKTDSILVCDDGTRAQVRGSAQWGPLEGAGFILVLEKKAELWVLVLVEIAWVS